jgi:hypothetical protein
MLIEYLAEGGLCGQGMSTYNPPTSKTLLGVSTVSRQSRPSLPYPAKLSF